MSTKGIDGLYFLPPGSTRNGSKYVELFKEKLVQHVKIYDCTIFMHDGALCHKSRLVQQFLDGQPIKVLYWPGNSPDLNPNKNLRALMKAKVSEKQPSTLEELQEMIKEVWVHEIFPNYW